MNKPSKRASPSKCCQSCHRSADELQHLLKRCSACKRARYCGRSCQRNDWPKHKKICTYIPKPKTGSKKRTTIPNQLPSPPSQNALADTYITPIIIPNPFSRLEARTYLHSRPSREEVYAILIDSFRLKVEDVFTITGKPLPGSIYDEVDDNGVELFRHYLLRAGHKGHLLPDWWSENSVDACIRYGTTAMFSNLLLLAHEQDFVIRYGLHGPLQLRCLAGQVYGKDELGDQEKVLVEMLLLNEKGTEMEKMEQKGELDIEMAESDSWEDSDGQPH